MPDYDFLRSLREDLTRVQDELAAPGVRDSIGEIARRVGAGEPETLAALWRTSKRHGETLAVFLNELRNQIQREEAGGEPAQTPSGANAAGG